MLEKIVANAINNPTLAISRLRKEYDSIREIGNYAAHRVLYNTRKKILIISNKHIVFALKSYITKRDC